MFQYGTGKVPVYWNLELCSLFSPGFCRNEVREKAVSNKKKTKKKAEKSRAELLKKIKAKSERRRKRVMKQV